MISDIISIATSEKGFRITVAILILVLYGSVTYVYGKQVDVNGEVKDKADKETIAQMLEQTRDMLKLQQSQTQFYMMQIEDTRRRLTEVELDTSRRLVKIETDQETINSNLEKLLKSVDKIATRIE